MFVFHGYYALTEISHNTFKVTIPEQSRFESSRQPNNKEFIFRIFSVDVARKMRIASRTVDCTLRELDKDIVTAEEIVNATLARRAKPSQVTLAIKAKQEQDDIISQELDNRITGVDNNYWYDGETFSIYLNLLSGTYRDNAMFVKENVNRIASATTRYVMRNPGRFQRIRELRKFKPVRAYILPTSQIEVQYKRIEVM